MNEKILNEDELKKKISELKKNKKKIIQCHGVFDVVHIGHINHFKKAKNFGDILVVSLTSDKFVNKGPNRPIFKQNKRLEFLSELECIDYVCLSNYPSAIDLIKIVKPDFYVKGQDYKSFKDDKTGKISSETQTVRKFGGKIIFTNEENFSSSNLINSNFSFNSEQKKYLNWIKKKYSIDFINKIFRKINKLKVLVIGETIIDQYNFCEALGKSGKEPYLALKEIDSEEYLGGAAAIANHIVEFTKKTKLVSMIGESGQYNKFIEKKLNKKIHYTFFKKKKSPTILKKRFIDHISKNKLFGIYSLNDDISPIKEDNKISKYIEKNIKNFDLIIVSDYGHGFISNNSARKIVNSRQHIALNAQVNASNVGYHTLQKYKKVSSAIINETELRHEMRNKKDDIKNLSIKLQKRLNSENLLVTRGSNGAILFSKKDNSVIESPAFANKVVDKVGAGDAMLSIISLLIKVQTPKDLSLLLGSFAGASSVESMGNSRSLSKKDFLRYIEFSLK